jgi:hypothetical protein
MNAPASAAAPPITGFLEESPGNRSAMRLMCMTSLIAAISFGAITMMRSAPISTRDANGQETLSFPPRDDTGMTITFVFLLSAFAPKVLQKFAEQRLNSYGSGAAAISGVSLPAQALPAPAALAPATEDPRFRMLHDELERLRAELERSRTPIQVSPATPIAAPPAALSPLERIRLAGGL